MANTGQTQGSMIAAIQSGQMAVGSAIAGGAGAVSSPADIEQTSILETMKEIAIDTRKSIDEMVEIQVARFGFDKDKFRREMDARREAEKERLKARLSGDQSIKLPTKEEATGGFGKLALGGIAALAVFAKALNVDEILRLPQQLKSIKAMATFAKGVGTIGTLGFGPKILDTMKSAFNSIFIKPADAKATNSQLAKRFKDLFKPVFNIFENIRYQFRLFTMSLRQPMQNLQKAIATGRKILRPVIATITTAFTTIRATLKPITDTIKGLFGGSSGVISKMLAPLKTLGRTIGRLFLPITLILGVIDGVQGFMKEFGETGSILDGIRGAVVGIVDGFIGGLVRLIGSAIEWILGFFGLDNLGKSINEKIGQLMDSFLLAVGGIVDLVMGLFSFDGERIMKGLGSMFSGVGGFFLNLLSAPIDLAINFLKDIFGFGDPDKPFSLKSWLFGGDGEKGLIGRIWDSITGIFSLPEGGILSGFVDSIINIGRVIKAIGAAGLAAAGAMLPGGESPGEAFSRKYNEVMSGGSSGDVTNTDTTNMNYDNTTGDVTTTNQNTRVINQGPPGMAPVTIVNSQPTTVNNQQSTSANTINAVNLDTSVDRQYERDAWAFAGA